MAQISTYATTSTPTIDDKLIGTDVENENVTRNFLISDILALSSSSSAFTATNVLYAASYIDQTPSALDTPLQVKFGAAQNTSTDPVMIDALGNVTFNQVGVYLFNGYGNVERQGSSGGVCTLLFRALIDGTQVGVVKGFDLDTTGFMIPYEVTTIINVTEVGTVLTWEILRDSSGVNAGGMYTHVTGSSWDNIPSSQLSIYKLS